MSKSVRSFALFFIVLFVMPLALGLGCNGSDIDSTVGNAVEKVTSGEAAREVKESVDNLKAVKDNVEGVIDSVKASPAPVAEYVVCRATAQWVEGLTWAGLRDASGVSVQSLVKANQALVEAYKDNVPVGTTVCIP